MWLLNLIVFAVLLEADLGRRKISWFRVARLTGVLADQAALYGVLAEIEALGLELTGVHRLPPHPPGDRPSWAIQQTARPVRSAIR